MTELLGKLQFKGQIPILLVDPPPTFDEKRTKLEILTAVHSVPENGFAYPFSLSFTQKKADLLSTAERLRKNLAADAVIWFAFPAPGSKTLPTDLTEELCWQYLKPFGFIPDKSVRLDTDWIALGYRRAT